MIGKKVHCHRGKSSETFLNKPIILKALNILPGQIIVDAGCGNGYMSKEFSKTLKNTGKVYALDPDRKAIETLKEETKESNIEPIVADITKTIPVEESSTDLIYLSTVLHGFSEDERESFQKEAKRVLKPNARLAIVEIEKFQVLELASRRAEQFLTQLDECLLLFLIYFDKELVIFVFFTHV